MRTSSLSRNFYGLGIFFSSLLLISGLIESIIILQIESKFYFLDAYIPWLTLTSIIIMIWAVILLKYFHSKKYQAAFVTGLIFAIIYLFHNAVFYHALVTGFMDHPLLMPVYLGILGCGILYALCLIGSRAGKRPWLKAAGFATFFYYLLLLFIHIWGINSPELQFSGVLMNYYHWAALAANLGYVFYIMNFRHERQASEKDVEIKGLQKSLHVFVSLAGIIAIPAIIILAPMLAQESHWYLAWHNSIPEREQKLVQQFEERTFVNQHHDSLPYLLLKPLDYDPQIEYPLVLSLPAGGYLGDLAEYLSSDSHRQKYPAFLMIPYCAPDKSWGGLPHFPIIDTLVFEAVSALDREFSIDRKRRYVTGSSKGAYGSWHFISTRPDMFAAAIPVCGAGNPQLGSNLVDVAVWAFHGEKDRNVPVSGSRNMIEAIKNAGGNPRYTEFPDHGHGIWEKVIETPELLEWLFAQQQE